MRIRSEWVTVLTVGGLAICGFVLPKHDSVPPANRDVIAAEGIDYTPVGSNRPIEKKKPAHRRRLPVPSDAQPVDP